MLNETLVFRQQLQRPHKQSKSQFYQMKLSLILTILVVATEAGPAPQVEDETPADPPVADYHGYYGYGGYGYGRRPAPYRPYGDWVT